MNTHKIGLKLENKVKEQLEKEGYWVIKPNWNRFAEKDFFGLFDLIAKKPGGTTLYVQVKSGKNLSPAKKNKVFLELCKFVKFMTPYEFINFFVFVPAKVKKGKLEKAYWELTVINPSYGLNNTIRSMAVRLDEKFNAINPFGLI